MAAVARMCGRARTVALASHEKEEEAVPDDKRKRGKPDRSRIAGGEAYEVNYFARKHGLTSGEAEKIIKQAKGNRDRANALAGKKR
jgi:hypothetical protein